MAHEQLSSSKVTLFQGWDVWVDYSDSEEEAGRFMVCCLQSCCSIISPGWIFCRHIETHRGFVVHWIEKMRVSLSVRKVFPLLHCFAYSDSTFLACAHTITLSHTLFRVKTLHFSTSIISMGPLSTISSSVKRVKKTMVWVKLIRFPVVRYIGSERRK